MSNGFKIGQRVIFYHDGGPDGDWVDTGTVIEKPKDSDERFSNLVYIWSDHTSDWRGYHWENVKPFVTISTKLCGK